MAIGAAGPSRQGRLRRALGGMLIGS